jgi:hypothetical protein
MKGEWKVIKGQFRNVQQFDRKQDTLYLIAQEAMREPRDWSVISIQDIWQELLVIRLNKKMRAKQKRNRWPVQFREAVHPYLPEIESLP